MDEAKKLPHYRINWDARAQKLGYADVKECLEHEAKSVSRAAKLLKVSKPTLRKKASEFGIETKRTVGAPKGNQHNAYDWGFYAKLGYETERAMWRVFKDRYRLKDIPRELKALGGPDVKYSTMCKRMRNLGLCKTRSKKNTENGTTDNSRFSQ